MSLCSDDDSSLSKDVEGSKDGESAVNANEDQRETENKGDEDEQEADVEGGDTDEDEEEEEEEEDESSSSDSEDDNVGDGTVYFFSLVSLFFILNGSHCFIVSDFIFYFS